MIYLYIFLILTSFILAPSYSRFPSIFLVFTFLLWPYLSLLFFLLFLFFIFNTFFLSFFLSFFFFFLSFFLLIMDVITTFLILSSWFSLFVYYFWFLSLEWPNLLAVEIVKLLDVPCKTALKKSETRPKLIRKWFNWK